MSTTPLSLQQPARSSGWWWLAAPLVAFVAYVAAMATLSDEAVGWLRSEAGPMEWAQALCFFAAGVVALRLAAVATTAPAWARLCYLGFGLMALLVTAEELSWGQHLFGFGTPETLGELNKQDEANLHNLWDDLPSRLMRRFLELGLPLLCLVLPIVLRVRYGNYRRGDWAWYTLPRLEMLPSLLIAALGRPFKASDEWGWPIRWYDTASEFAEVFWAFAILVWIVVVSRRITRPEMGATPMAEMR